MKQINYELNVDQPQLAALNLAPGRMGANQNRKLKMKIKDSTLYEIIPSL